MNFPRKRFVFTVLMKSGNSFEVVAENCNIKRDTSTGQLTSYEFTNIKPGTTLPLYLHLDQVEAINYSTKKVW